MGVSWIPTAAVWAITAAAAAGCGGRDHPLINGPYQFALESNLIDGCGLSSAAPFTWTGSLDEDGEYVRLTYDPLEITLKGAYGEVSDAFELAGNRGPVNVLLPGGACDVEFVQVLIDGTTDAPNAFHGTLQVRYEKRNSDACSCETRSTYRASR